MKLRRIEIKAAGCTVALNLKEQPAIPEGTDVLTILDRHVRQVLAELTAPRQSAPLSASEISRRGA